MSDDVKSTVVRKRAEILQGLVSLAVSERPDKTAESYRSRAESLIEQLEVADKTIAFLTPVQNWPYAQCELAIDAVIDYLKDIARPASERQIIEGVLKGGFRGGKKGTDLRLHKTIDAHVRAAKGLLKNPGDMVGKIKEVHGLIGLHEWNDGAFTIPQ